MASSSAPKKSLTPARKHRKLLKDGSGAEVWPESIEAVFVRGLKDYWDSPYATYSQPRGRSRWRNQYLVDYLERAGINRTKKQVASHIQVLRNMWKGQPEFYLVAAGDEPPTDTPPVKLEDRCDIAILQNERDPSSSPEFSPVDFPPTPPQADTLASLPSSSSPMVKEQSPFDYNSPSLSIYPLDCATHASLNTPTYPSYYSSDYSNYCTALRLVADGMTPFSVKVDTLMSSQPLGGSTLVLKIKLCITSVSDTRSPPSLHGFASSISLARAWTNSAKCLTRVHAQNLLVSNEVAPLEFSNLAYGSATVTLPESTLSRCRWLDQSLQTRITQEITVDNEVLLHIIYDLDRSRGAMPSAELLGYQSCKASGPSQFNCSFTPPGPSAYPIFQSPSPSQTSLAGALTPSFSLSSSMTVY